MTNNDSYAGSYWLVITYMGYYQMIINSDEYIMDNHVKQPEDTSDQ